jgi:hypothetical protein
VRSPEEIERVKELSAEHNKCEIARLTGIPRSTISGWLNGRAPRFAADRTRGGSCLRCGYLRHPFASPAVYEYAYLLGLYLGDGCLLKHPRGVYRLHVFLDSAYPVIAAECEASMSLVMPESQASCRRHPRWNMLNLVSYSTHWPHLFPQHGPGRKHQRKIALEPWQQLIADRYPGRLLRGLIHSDGCRVTNVIHHPKKTYAYPRYFFSNHSLDIQGIFCEACDRLGSLGDGTGPGTSQSPGGTRSRSSTAISDQSAKQG